MARWSLLACFTVVTMALGVCGGLEIYVDVELEGTVSKSSVLCDTCLELSNDAQLILSNPDTQKEAIKFLSQLACLSLTERLKVKCLQLVDGYVPDALEALQAFLGPQICTDVGVCFPDDRFFGQGEQLHDQFERSDANTREKPLDFEGGDAKRGNLRCPIPLSDGRTCLLCQEFARDALSYLESDTAKSDILAALHRACAKWDTTKQCDLLVDIYGPGLIKRLDNLTAEEVCETTHLCKPSNKASSAANPRVQRNDCAVCQFVVLEVKIKLEDPVIQERLFEVLLNGCDRVQNHVDECRLIVEQYAPFILANLDTMLNADLLCSKIGACRSNAAVFEHLLAVLPSRHAGRVHDVKRL